MGKLVIALLSVLLGGGAATVAASSVVNSNAPDDTVAVKTGPKTTVEPSAVITYGR